MLGFLVIALTALIQQKFAGKLNVCGITGTKKNSFVYSLGLHTFLWQVGSLLNWWKNMCLACWSLLILTLVNQLRL